MTIIVVSFRTLRSLKDEQEWPPLCSDYVVAGKLLGTTLFDTDIILV